jgi:hypothetical protein
MPGTTEQRVQTKLLTTADVAKHFIVNIDKILGFINSGELEAINIAKDANGKNPRWRITPEALADFERRRSSAPPAKPSRRKQPASDSYQPKYYKP